MVLAAAGSGPADKLPPVETVKEVDLARYMGKWFEIAAFPQKFQKGCHCTTAEYELTVQGTVKVVNTCRKGGADGKVSRAKGKAWVVPGTGNARLKVQFFWPFKGNYWIIDLADDYSFAVVGDPSRKYLWVLSRTPRMDPALYAEIRSTHGRAGFRHEPSRRRRPELLLGPRRLAVSRAIDPFASATSP